MRKTLLITSVALLGMMSAAQAQSGTSTTVTETTVTTTTVPDEVRTYIVGQEAESLTLEGELVVGEVLPETIVVSPIPDNTEYGYAIVNDRRVVLDPQTRTVIEVYD